ncbi:hypothetical protein F2B00_20720 [Streptomyces parvus]|uniref:DUF6193 family natural product biosynthesis protein n=1 Tax=Streptomyces parvus TaxID=66428 RepID=UPI00123A90BA|nr:DUF6193 family natural product biosynthesis protein [Streptomyces parvus]KAA6200342.1 hypothetical protein F2B00_20720 [Streptomyces parvus]GGS26717.1 hypothetical protein GCM10010221_25010 [Streptomyces parvus]
MAAENGAGTPGSVIREWQSVLAEPSGVIDPALARAAHANPRLRSLFPLISHGSLQLSRCTRPPWSRDVPSLLRRRDGRFCVIRLWETGESGRRDVGVADTAPEAVALLSAALPEDWGPAIEGAADKL